MLTGARKFMFMIYFVLSLLVNLGKFVGHLFSTMKKMPSAKNYIPLMSHLSIH